MYRNSPKPLGDLLKDFIETYPRRRELKRGMVLSVWPEIVGNSISKECSNVKFDGDRLIVTIKNPGWRHEVHMQRYSIMTRLNKEVDEDIVKEIIIRA